MNPHQQPSEAPQSLASGAGQRFNSLKHGLFSIALLLPGDDAVEFQRQRLVLFHDYLPQTEDEAELVEALAECRWLRRRYSAVQARFDEQWLEPEADAAGRVCEPLGHQRVHSSIDVTKHRLRVERAWHKARAQLFLLQQQRRLGLVGGAAKLPRDCYMDSSGVVRGPVVRPAVAPVPELVSDHNPQAAQMESSPSCSTHGRNGKGTEQKENPTAHRSRALGVPRAIPFPHTVAIPPRWTPPFEPLCVNSVAPMSFLAGENGPCG